MARRKKDQGITPEQRAKITDIAELLVQAAGRCNSLEQEAEATGSHEIYVELLQEIHRRLGVGDSLYYLTQTLQDADDSEMRCPQ